MAPDLNAGVRGVNVVNNGVTVLFRPEGNDHLLAGLQARGMQHKGSL